MSNLFNDDLHCGQNVNNETEKLEKQFFTCLHLLLQSDVVFLCGSLVAAP